MSPSERKLRATLASHQSWANTADRTARTQAGRDAFAAKFEDQVDPDRTLPEGERLLRAESARKAYYASLAYKSARARRRNKAIRGGDAA